MPESVPAELPPILAVLVLWILGLVVRGFVNARIELRHPEVKRALGDLDFVGSEQLEGWRHGLRWLRFTCFDHFAVGDLLLSSLCMLETLVGISLLAAFFWATRSLSGDAA